MRSTCVFTGRIKVNRRSAHFCGFEDELCFVAVVLSCCFGVRLEVMFQREPLWGGMIFNKRELVAFSSLLLLSVHE